MAIQQLEILQKINNIYNMVSASKDGAVYLLQCLHHFLGHLLKVKETHHVLCYTEDNKKFMT